MISDLNIFSDAPTDSSGVRLANSDYAAIDHGDDLTRFEAEYLLGMHEIDCLHCLLESQLRLPMSRGLDVNARHVELRSYWRARRRHGSAVRRGHLCV